MPEHDMWSMEVFLNRLRPAVAGPVRWAIHLKDGGHHVLETDGSESAAEAFTITGDPDRVTEFKELARIR